MSKLTKAVRDFDQEMIDNGFWARLNLKEDFWFDKYWGFVLTALQEEEQGESHHSSE